MSMRSLYAGFFFLVVDTGLGPVEREESIIRSYDPRSC